MGINDGTAVATGKFVGAGTVGYSVGKGIDGVVDGTAEGSNDG